MRARFSLIIVSVLILVAPAALQAGLYSTVETEGTIDANFRAFQDGVMTLHQIGSAETKSHLHKRYGLIKDLVAKGIPEKLTVEQRLNLSAYLMRVKLLRKPVPGAQLVYTYRTAAEVLKPALKDDPDHFLILANLATAEMLEAAVTHNPRLQELMLRRAHKYQEDALKKWPEKWTDLKKDKQVWLRHAGWRPEDFERLRRAETFQLRLVTLRLKEAAARKEPPKFFAEDVDALFGDERKPVRFVSDSGGYEAGKIAAAQRAGLPKDHLEIIQQLFLWMPDDLRLYWLLGELYNAEGEVDVARKILEEIRTKVNPAPPKKTEKDDTKKSSASFEPQDLKTPRLLKEHLVVLRAVPEKDLKIVETPKTTTTPTTTKPPKVDSAVEQATPFPIDLQTFGVGFGVGLVVTLLGVWQLREFRRRRLPSRTP
jgi:hypothetical protein